LPFFIVARVFAEDFLVGAFATGVFATTFLTDFFFNALETVVFVADANCFTVLDPAISRAFAPAIPPAIAPTAAPIGPIKEPAAAPAAAPPTICKPVLALDFVPVFFDFAIHFSFEVNSPRLIVLDRR